MSDLLTAQQLAEYLQLSKRTIYRLVDRHQVPAVRVGGQWRFPKSAVDYWLDLRLGEPRAPELGVLEPESGLSVSLEDALDERHALVPLAPAAPGAVVAQLVQAVRFPEPVDRALVVKRVMEREALCSTALPGGIAILHTARWLPRVLRTHDVVAIGRCAQALDFGALGGGRTDLFVLVLARNERHHLVLLTKMARLCQGETFVPALRSSTGAGEVVAQVRRFEKALFQPVGSGT